MNLCLPKRFVSGFSRRWPGFAYLPLVIIIALTALLIPTVKYITDQNVSFNVLKRAKEVTDCSQLSKKADCKAVPGCNWKTGETKTCQFDSKGNCPKGCDYNPGKERSLDCSRLADKKLCRAKTDCQWKKAKTKKVCSKTRIRQVYKDCGLNQCQTNTSGCTYEPGYCECSRFNASQDLCEANYCKWHQPKCSGRYKAGTEEICAIYEEAEVKPAHCSGRYKETSPGSCSGEIVVAGFCQGVPEKPEAAGTQLEAKPVAQFLVQCTMTNGEKVNAGEVVYWKKNPKTGEIIKRECGNDGLWKPTSKELTIIPSFLKEKPTDQLCKTKAGTLVQHGETVYGNVKAGKNLIYRCNNGRWVECPDCKAPTIKPYYGTQGKPELQNCIVDRVIYKPGDKLVKDNKIYVCRNGGLEETKEEEPAATEEIDEDKLQALYDAYLDCKKTPSFDDCYQAVLFEFEPNAEEMQLAEKAAAEAIASDKRLATAQKAYLACGDEALERDDCPEFLEAYSQLDIDEQGIINDYIAQQQQFVAEQQAALAESERKIQAAYEKAYEVYQQYASCDAVLDPIICRQTAERLTVGLPETAQEQFTDLVQQHYQIQISQHFLNKYAETKESKYLDLLTDSLAKLSNEQLKNDFKAVALAVKEAESSLGQCQVNCDKHYGIQGKCVLNLEGAPQCVQMAAMAKQNNIAKLDVIYEAADECGGLGNVCCPGPQSCNTGLKCNTDTPAAQAGLSGTCIYDDNYQMAQAVNQLIEQTQQLNNGTISKKQIETIIDNNYQLNPGILAYLRESSENICSQDCGTGACVYSEKDKAFECAAAAQYYRDNYQSAEPRKGDLDQVCRGWIFKSCNNNWLYCDRSDNVCRLKDAAKQILANEATGNSYSITDFNLSYFTPAEAEELRLNPELASVGCSERDRQYFQNGACWRCLDPVSQIAQPLPLEFCQNQQLAQALPGYKCHQAGGYCALDNTVTNNEVKWLGSKDCPQDQACYQMTSGDRPGLGQSCSNSIFATIQDRCVNGLKCFQNVCQEEGVLAFNPEFANGVVANWLEQKAPITKFLLSPIIRAFSFGSYHEAIKFRAKAQQYTIDQLASVEGWAETDLGSQLFSSLDQAAQAKLASLKLKDQGELGFYERVYLVGSEIWQFASAYTGEPPLARGGASGTNAFFEYAQKQAEINAKAKELSYWQVQGQRLGASVLPGIQVGFVGADIITGGLAGAGRLAGKLGWTTASKAMLAPTRLAEGAVEKFVLLRGAKKVEERVLGGVIGVIVKPLQAGSSLADKALVATAKNEKVWSWMTKLPLVGSKIASRVERKIALEVMEGFEGELTRSAIEKLVSKAKKKGFQGTGREFVEIAVLPQLAAQDLTEEAIVSLAAVYDDLLRQSSLGRQSVDELAAFLVKKADSQRMFDVEFLAQAKKAAEAFDAARRFKLPLANAEEFLTAYQKLTERLLNEGPASRQVFKNLFKDSLDDEAAERLFKAWDWEKSPLLAGSKITEKEMIERLGRAGYSADLIEQWGGKNSLVVEKQPSLAEKIASWWAERRGKKPGQVLTPKIKANDLKAFRRAYVATEEKAINYRIKDGLLEISVNEGAKGVRKLKATAATVEELANEAMIYYDAVMRRAGKLGPLEKIVLESGEVLERQAKESAEDFALRIAKKRLADIDKFKGARVYVEGNSKPTSFFSWYELGKDSKAQAEMIMEAILSPGTKILEGATGAGKTDVVMSTLAYVKQQLTGKKVTMIFKNAADMNKFLPVFNEVKEVFDDLIAYRITQVPPPAADKTLIEQANIFIGTSDTIFASLEKTGPGAMLTEALQGSILIADEAHISLRLDTAYIKSIGETIVIDKEAAVRFQELFDPNSGPLGYLVKDHIDDLSSGRMSRLIEFENGVARFKDEVLDEAYKNLANAWQDEFGGIIDFAQAKDIRQAIDQFLTQEGDELVGAQQRIIKDLAAFDSAEKVFTELPSNQFGLGEKIISVEGKTEVIEAVVPFDNAAPSGRQYSTTYDELAYQGLGWAFLEKDAGKIASLVELAEKGYLTITDNALETNYARFLAETFDLGESVLMTATPNRLAAQFEKRFGIATSVFTSEEVIAQRIAQADYVKVNNVRRLLDELADPGAGQARKFVVGANGIESESFIDDLVGKINSQGRDVAVVLGNGETWLYKADGTKELLESLADINRLQNKQVLDVIYGLGANYGTDLESKATDKFMAIFDSQSDFTDFVQTIGRDRCKQGCADLEVMFVGERAPGRLDEALALFKDNELANIRAINLQDIEQEIKDAGYRLLKTLEELDAERGLLGRGHDRQLFDELRAEWRQTVDVNPTLGKTTYTREEYLAEQLNRLTAFVDRLANDEQLMNGLSKQAKEFINKAKGLNVTVDDIGLLGGVTSEKIPTSTAVTPDKLLEALNSVYSPADFEKNIVKSKSLNPKTTVGILTRAQAEQPAERVAQKATEKAVKRINLQPAAAWLEKTWGGLSGLAVRPVKVAVEERVLGGVIGAIVKPLQAGASLADKALVATAKNEKVWSWMTKLPLVGSKIASRVERKIALEVVEKQPSLAEKIASWWAERRGKKPGQVRLAQEVGEEAEKLTPAPSKPSLQLSDITAPVDLAKKLGLTASAKFIVFVKLSAWEEAANIIKNDFTIFVNHDEQFIADVVENWDNKDNLIAIYLESNIDQDWSPKLEEKYGITQDEYKKIFSQLLGAAYEEVKSRGLPPKTGGPPAPLLPSLPPGEEAEVGQTKEAEQARLKITRDSITDTIRDLKARAEQIEQQNLPKTQTHSFVADARNQLINTNLPVSKRTQALSALLAELETINFNRYRNLAKLTAVDQTLEQLNQQLGEWVEKAAVLDFQLLEGKGPQSYVVMNGQEVSIEEAIQRIRKNRQALAQEAEKILAEEPAEIPITIAGLLVPDVEAHRQELKQLAQKATRRFVLGKGEDPQSYVLVDGKEVSPEEAIRRIKEARAALTQQAEEVLAQEPAELPVKIAGLLVPSVEEHRQKLKDLAQKQLQRTAQIKEIGKPLTPEHQPYIDRIINSQQWSDWNIEVLRYLGGGFEGETFLVRRRGDRLESEPELYAAKVEKEGNTQKESLNMNLISYAQHKGKYANPDEVSYTVKPYEYDPKTKVLIMEFLPGKSLSDLLDSMAATDKTSLQLALQLAHFQYLIRQENWGNADFKIENFYIEADGSMRVIDIGSYEQVKPEDGFRYKEDHLWSLYGLSIFSALSESKQAMNLVTDLIELNRRQVDFSKLSKHAQYDIGQIVNSNEFRQLPVGIRYLTLQSLQLLNHLPDEPYSLDQYEERLLDVLAIAKQQGLPVETIPAGLRHAYTDKLLSRLEKFTAADTDLVTFPQQRQLTAEELEQTRKEFVKGMLRTYIGWQWFATSSKAIIRLMQGSALVGRVPDYYKELETVSEFKKELEFLALEKYDLEDAEFVEAVFKRWLLLKAFDWQAAHQQVLLAAKRKEIERQFAAGEIDKFERDYELEKLWIVPDDFPSEARQALDDLTKAVRQLTWRITVGEWQIQDLHQQLKEIVALLEETLPPGTTLGDVDQEIKELVDSIQTYISKAKEAEKLTPAPSKPSLQLSDITAPVDLAKKLGLTASAKFIVFVKLSAWEEAANLIKTALTRLVNDEQFIIDVAENLDNKDNLIAIYLESNIDQDWSPEMEEKYGLTQEEYNRLMSDLIEAAYEEVKSRGLPAKTGGPPAFSLPLESETPQQAYQRNLGYISLEIEFTDLGQKLAQGKTKGAADRLSQIIQE